MIEDVFQCGSKVSHFLQQYSKFETDTPLFHLNLLNVCKSESLRGGTDGGVKRFIISDTAKSYLVCVAMPTTWFLDWSFFF